MQVPSCQAQVPLCMSYHSPKPSQVLIGTSHKNKPSLFGQSTVIVRTILEYQFSNLYSNGHGMCWGWQDERKEGTWSDKSGIWFQNKTDTQHVHVREIFFIFLPLQWNTYDKYNLPVISYMAVQTLSF